MDKDEALKLALEKVANALPAYIEGTPAREYLAVIHSALAAPVQEPVATLFGSLPVYDTTPPAAQRQWVGLTDEEFEDIELGCRSTVSGKIMAMQKVEAKLKEKNT
jgi:hypothetical protein